MNTLKRFLSVLTAFFLLATACLMPASAKVDKGVNRGLVRRPDDTVFEAQLRVGDLSFYGTLQRLDRVTDEKVEECIKKALDQAGLTELEVGELTRLVREDADSRKITKEQVDEFKENLKTVTGAGTAIDIADLLTGGTASAEQIIRDIIAGELQGKVDEYRDAALDALIKGGSDVPSAIATAQRVIDTLTIIADQMEKDQSKWKKRADAANAFRKLQSLYEDINDRIDRERTSKQHGWELKVEDDAGRNLTFFGVANNYETWRATMLMRKMDVGTADPEGPSGTYEGTASFEVTYDLNPFDTGFAGYASSAANKETASAGMDVSFTDTGKSSPTEASRWLVNDRELILEIIAMKPQKGQTATFTVYPDFSGFKDDKELNINRDLLMKATQTMMGTKLTYSGSATFYSEGTDRLVQRSGESTVSGKVMGKSYSEKVPGSVMDVPFDSSIWEQWNMEKSLTIIGK